LIIYYTYPAVGRSGLCIPFGSPAAEGFKKLIFPDTRSQTFYSQGHSHKPFRAVFPRHFILRALSRHFPRTPLIGEN
jgi:hypothetical protein